MITTFCLFIIFGNYIFEWCRVRSVTDKSKWSEANVAPIPLAGAAYTIVVVTRLLGGKMLKTIPASNPSTARLRCLYSTMALTETAASNTSEQTRT